MPSIVLAGLAAAVVLGAGTCTRGDGNSERRVPNQGLTRGPGPRAGAGVQPGIFPRTVLGEVKNPYADDRAAVAAGRQLFTGMNCAGCHSAYAGGGMGPSLRDSLWIYGSTDAQIFSTIAEGRPYGMPAWGGRLPDDQIWQLVAYIRTLGTPDEPVKPPTPSQGAAPAPGRTAG
jgi:cytochrome c oxidase cbb3-type subunit 3